MCGLVHVQGGLRVRYECHGEVKQSERRLSADWTVKFLRENVCQCYVGKRLVDRIKVKHGHEQVHTDDDLADIFKRCENRVDCVTLTVELGAAAQFSCCVGASGGHCRDGVSHLLPTSDRPHLASTYSARHSGQRNQRRGPC
jgi:hypothetical protein